MKKVLFIDDDERLVEIMRRIFVMKSFDFSFAYDAETGMQKAAEIHPDIIILDIALPDASGFEACKTIKTTEGTRKIPVIFITGRYMTEDDIVEGLKIGADDYIQKPFDVDELITRIDTVLRGYNCVH